MMKFEISPASKMLVSLKPLKKVGWSKGRRIVWLRSVCRALHCETFPLQVNRVWLNTRHGASAVPRAVWPHGRRGTSRIPRLCQEAFLLCCRNAGFYRLSLLEPGREEGEGGRAREGERRGQATGEEQSASPLMGMLGGSSTNDHTWVWSWWKEPITMTVDVTMQFCGICCQVWPSSSQS